MTLQDELKKKISDVLVPLLTGYTKNICIIDPPSYPNVGDSAIFIGQINFIREYFPDSRICFFDYFTYTENANKFIEECSVILLQGGGSFGDIWMHHHQVRMKVIRSFPNKRIIQFPQSLSFSDTDILTETAQAIRLASDFHLIVRDKTSEAFALKNFECPISLAPDMAFFMKPISRLPAEVNCFCLLRADTEAVANHDEILRVVASQAKSYEVGDWLDEPATLAKRIDRRLAVATREQPARTWMLQGLMLKVRERYARERLAVGIALLSRGSIVVTDRLHAHILSCLLKIPHVFFNSMDGKVGAFYGAWTHTETLARLATTPDDLDKLMQENRIEHRSTSA